MYKRHWTFFIYSTLLAVTLSFSNQAYGQLNGGASTNKESFSYWIDHLPYNSVSHIAHLDGLTFCGADQGLLVYDNAAGEYQRFSSINGLSDAGITAIAADVSSSSCYVTDNVGLQIGFICSASKSTHLIAELLLRRNFDFRAAKLGVV